MQDAVTPVPRFSPSGSCRIPQALPHEEDNLEIYDEVDGDAMDAQGNEREAAAKGDASESEESSSGDDETSEEVRR